jgi:hypothetical protein
MGRLTYRMRMIPADIGAQYRRNRLRDSGSVVATRVRVTNRDWLGPSGSAPSVQAIFTYPDWSNAANCSGDSEWNLTCWCQGWV